MNFWIIRRKETFKYLFVIAITLASVLVMSVLVFQNRDVLRSIRSQVQIFPLLLTLPTFLISALLTGFVWGKIVNSLGVNIPLHKHILIYLATSFWGRLPGGLWHVIGRVAMYERMGVLKRITTVASLLQWFLIIYSGILTTLLLLPFVYNVTKYVLFYFLIIFLIGGVLLNPRIFMVVLRKFLKTPSVYEVSFFDLIEWLICYIIIWMFGGLLLHLVLYSFSIQSLFLPFSIVAWSIGNVSGTIITFLPTGFGITEAITSVLLALQIPSSLGVLSSILLRILLTIYDFIFSILSFLIIRIMRFPVL